MSYVVPRDPVLLVDTDPGGTPTVEDWSCYVRAVDLGSDTAEVDVSSFCAPSATAPGKVTDSCTFAVLFSEAMHTALKAQVGKDLTFSLKFDNGDAKAIEWLGRFATTPWGNITPGEVVEGDLVVAVLTTPDYVTPTVVSP